MSIIRVLCAAAPLVGAALLSSCGGDRPTSPVTSAVDPVILSTTQLAQIDSVEPNRILFEMGSPAAAALDVGDVIVAGISAQTPEGLLRKVRTKGESGGHVVVETSAARLTDAIQDGAATGTFTLTADPEASLIDEGLAIRGAANGVSLTFTDFQVDGVRFNGNVSLNPVLEVNLDIEDGTLAKLDWKVTSTFTSELSVKSPSLLPVTIGGSESIGKRRLRPVVFFVGFVPVVVTPEIEFRAEASGKISAEVALSVKQSYVTTVGGAYSGGAWTSVSGFSESSSYTLPTKLKLEAEARVGLGARATLSLYGMSDQFSAYAELGPYAKASVTPLAADTIWKIHGGLQGDIGLTSTLFDPKFVNMSRVKVFSHDVFVKASLREVDRVVLSPDSSDIQFRIPAGPAAKLYDVEGRVLTRTIAWASSNPGVATVDTTGVVMPVGYGRTVISATSEGKVGTAVMIMRPLQLQLKAPSTTLTGSRTTTTNEDGTQIGTLSCSMPTEAVVTGGGLGRYDSFNWVFASSIHNESKQEPRATEFRAGTFGLPSAFYTTAMKDGKADFVPFSISISVTWTDLVTNAMHTSNAVSISCS